MSIASELQVEVNAYLSLIYHNQPVPVVLSVESMRRRYVLAAMKVEEDERRHPIRLTFYDGSIAEASEHDKRIWREVEHGS